MRRILMVTTALPTPLKPRPFRFALGLAREVEVHVAFVEESPGSRVPRRIREEALTTLRDAGVSLHALRWSPAAPIHAGWNLAISGLSARESLFRQPGLRRDVESLHQVIAPDVIHVDRVRAASLVEGIPGPKLFDFTDPVGWYLAGRAAGRSGLLGALLAEEARRVWRLEIAVAGSRALVCFASELGERAFLARAPSARTCVIHNAVPEAACVAPMHLAGTRPRIGFWGNLGYPPNVEGVEGFCGRSWPAVRRRLPTATLHIAGSWPTARVKRLQRIEGVSLHPNPVDMPSFIRACDLAIAPLSTCAGISNKILEAATWAVPIVATEVACAGLPDFAAREVPVVSSPEEWARALAKAWEDRTARPESIQRLRDRIGRDLSPGEITRRLLEAYRLVSSCQGTATGSPESTRGDWR